MKKLAMHISLFWMMMLMSACILNRAVDVVPLPPEPAAHGPVYVSSTQVLVMESFPVQVRIEIEGELPDPCHEYEYAYAFDLENDLLVIDLYSLPPQGEVACVTVLEPFSLSISPDLQDLPDGEYEVLLNGQVIGSFSYPG
jgi:hypothetical protein